MIELLFLVKILIGVGLYLLIGMAIGQFLAFSHSGHEERRPD